MIKPLSRCLLILCFLVISSSAGFGQSATVSLSLPQAIEQALQNNQQYLIAKAELKKAESKITETYGVAMPNIEGRIQYSYNLKKPVFFLPDFQNPGSGKVNAIEIGSDNAFNAQVNLTQALYSRTVGTALEIAEVYQSFSEVGLKNTESTVVYEVKKAYYGALLAKQVYEVTQRIYVLTEANNKNVQNMYQQGMASEFDALRMDVQLANLSPRVIQAENAFHLAVMNLKNLIGLDQQQSISLTESFKLELIPQDQLTIYRQSFLDNNLTVKQLQIQKDLLEKNVQIESSGFWPSLYGFWNYTYQSQANDFNFSKYNWVGSSTLGLNLSIPIFSGFQTREKVQQAKIDVQKVEYQLKDISNNLQLALSSAEMRLVESKKRVDAQTRSVEQAEKALKIAEARYANGVGLQLEVMDAQVALSQTLTNQAQATYDYLMAKAEWEKLVAKN